MFCDCVSMIQNGIAMQDDTFLYRILYIGKKNDTLEGINGYCVFIIR